MRARPRTLSWIEVSETMTGEQPPERGFSGRFLGTQSIGEAQKIAFQLAGRNTQIGRAARRDLVGVLQPAGQGSGQGIGQRLLLRGRQDAPDGPASEYEWQ